MLYRITITGKDNVMLENLENHKGSFTNPSLIRWLNLKSRVTYIRILQEDDVDFLFYYSGDEIHLRKDKHRMSWSGTCSIIFAKELIPFLDKPVSIYKSPFKVNPA
mgnify:CR=1 FL=1